MRADHRTEPGILLNSFTFATFFIVVMAVYFACRRRLAWQNGMLLVASYFFYGWWGRRFLGLIIVSTLIDFVCGKVLDRRVEIDGGAAGGEPAPYTRTEKTRRRVLLLSVGTNLGILGFFKYYDFFAASCAEDDASQRTRDPLCKRIMENVVPD